MIDPAVSNAIRRAASDHHQHDHVADKIIKWLEAVSDGNERLEDKDAVQRRLELLYGAVQIPYNRSND